MIYLFDLGGTSIKGLKLTDDKKEIKEYLLEYEQRVNIYNVELKHGLDLIKKVIKEENEENVKVALSVPGTVDVIKRRILTESIFVNVNFDVEKYIKELKNVIECVFNNDGKCATLGEFNYGDHKDVNSAFLITLGTSIGGGVMLNKKIYIGSHNSSLSLDRTFLNIIDTKDRQQGGLLGMGHTIMKYCKDHKKDPRTFTGISLCQEYLKGESYAVKTLNDWSTKLAKLLINAQLIIDVEEIYIGGGVSNFQPFMDMVTTKFCKYAKELQLELPKIERATLTNKAGCYGALYCLENKEKIK